MLIKGAMLHYALFFEGLKTCADSCTHVKKVHSHVNLVSVEICAGMGPVNLFDGRSLQTNKFECMLIKSAVQTSLIKC